MRTTTLLAALATAWMAGSGCAPMATITASHNPHCTADPTCKVTMAISTGTGGAACTLSDPGTVTVDKGHSPVIEWELHDTTGVGYKFPPNGIEFTAKERYLRPPEGVFKIIGPGPATVFRVKDNNTVAGVFNYKVTVVKPDGSPGCQLDPPIYNGP